MGYQKHTEWLSDYRYATARRTRAAALGSDQSARSMMRLRKPASSARLLSLRS